MTSTEEKDSRRRDSETQDADEETLYDDLDMESATEDETDSDMEFETDDDLEYETEAETEIETEAEITDEDISEYSDIEYEGEKKRPWDREDLDADFLNEDFPDEEVSPAGLTFERERADEPIIHTFRHAANKKETQDEKREAKANSWAQKAPILPQKAPVLPLKAPAAQQPKKWGRSKKESSAKEPLYSETSGFIDMDEAEHIRAKSERADREYISSLKKNSRKYPLQNVYSEYETMDGEEASSALKIVLGCITIIFICILAGLVYKINDVSAELKVAREELDSVPNQEEFNRLLAESQSKSRTIEQLTNELSQYKGGTDDLGLASTLDTGSLYTVVAGDSLTRIANKFDTTTDKLKEWNDIKNENNIQVGQRLRVAPPAD